MSKPEAGNKFYTRKESGGYSTCIKGKPTDKCDVLANCVGYACGRFNEIYSQITGYNGMKYPYFNCNAENFIERAKSFYPELSITTTPHAGAIAVWQKGNTLSGSDGAGHVAIVEKVLSPTEIVTSESGYGGTAFFTKTRRKDNNWGQSGYLFRGFIVNPVVKEDPTPTVKITGTVVRDTTKNQIQVNVTNLRVRVSPSLKATTLGYARKGIYNYTETKVADNYTWYKIAENNWIAYDKSWAILFPVNTIKVGDLVRLDKKATVYNTLKKFKAWVYEKDLYLYELKGNRAVIYTSDKKTCVGAVDKKYLKK